MSSCTHSDTLLTRASQYGESVKEVEIEGDKGNGYRMLLYDNVWIEMNAKIKQVLNDATNRFRYLHFLSW